MPLEPGGSKLAACLGDDPLPTEPIVPNLEGRHHRPHMTGYNRNGTEAILCRCANPLRQGEAFSRPDRPDASFGFVGPPRDLNSNQIS
jgi:hypothetical protein